MTRLMLMHDTSKDLHMIKAAANNLEGEFKKDESDEDYIANQFDLLRRRRQQLLETLDKWYLEDKAKNETDPLEILRKYRNPEGATDEYNEDNIIKAMKEYANRD